MASWVHTHVWRGGVARGAAKGLGGGAGCFLDSELGVQILCWVSLSGLRTVCFPLVVLQSRVFVVLMAWHGGV